MNRIAALSGGKGGGRPHFASAGAGDPSKLPPRGRRAQGVVSAWLSDDGGVTLSDWLDRHTAAAPAALRDRVRQHAVAVRSRGVRCRRRSPPRAPRR